jgi:hypothetical protein
MVCLLYIIIATARLPVLAKLNSVMKSDDLDGNQSSWYPYVTG